MPNPAKKMKKNKTGAIENAIHSGGPGFTQTDVGRRIRVHWNPREAYDGVIDNFNPINESARIQYDDGDEEWFNPLDASAAETSWEFLSPRSLSCGGCPGFEQADVGRRIRVHWNPREAYDGVIDTFNPDNACAHIQYDDGDEEWLNPLVASAAEMSWEFLSPRQSCPGVKPKRIQMDDDENATPRSAEGEESSDEEEQKHELLSHLIGLRWRHCSVCSHKSKTNKNLREHEQKVYGLI
ncbi:hypothetical protein TrST_g11639 [Triparma strigata]|uniref:Uncharacterized protein n=1 Tax=Triparma strigata TaxID=1606541 RepID=A0A9W7B8P5_9STRA|nr:hypothetical protein TrST_g11639 [Triparma strigata]